MLVRCRSGRDRSAFAIFAYLRLYHGATFADATDFLNERRNIYGQNLVDLDLRDPGAQRWLEHEIAHAEWPLPQPPFHMAWANGTCV